MAWGAKNSQASQVGQGPFTADYNRSYDTNTRNKANSQFAVNPPNSADVGPHDFPGIGPDANERAYKNPSNRYSDPDYPGARQDQGYLGHEVGPRELQTGNAPSGGYTTLPGLGFAEGFQSGAIPDNRRMAERNRGDDWERYQEQVHAQRDSELRYRRSLNVEESWTQFDQDPQPGKPGGFSAPVNAIEDSPYRKDWSDNHSDMGPGSMTHNTNPNKFRNFDYFDRDTNYRQRTRYMNGTHYSMAEHNSLVPYINQAEGGSSVQQYKRNTYYLTPQPWDTTNTDGPSQTAGYATTTTLGSGDFTGSYRL